MKIMSWLVIAGLVIILVASPVLAMERTLPKIYIPAHPVHPGFKLSPDKLHQLPIVAIPNLNPGSGNIAQYKYVEKPYSDNIITATKQILKIEPLLTDTDVYIENEIVATIPDDSKFKDVVIHDNCLKFGYGTDKWNKCEDKL